MLPEIPPEQYARCLDNCARRLLEKGDVQEPPVDVVRLAQGLGFTVAQDARMCGRARFVRLGGVGEGSGRDTILLGPEMRHERRQWAVAHELGEAMAHQVFAALDAQVAEAGRSTREAVANELARRLLLPQPWFSSDSEQYDCDLFALKSRYATASHELIARRLLDLDRPLIISVFDQEELTWRRGNVSHRVPPLGADERSVRQKSHRERGIADHTAGHLRIRCWPIHEREQQREIMYTECLETID